MSSSKLGHPHQRDAQDLCNTFSLPPLSGISGLSTRTTLCCCLLVGLLSEFVADLLKRLSSSLHSFLLSTFERLLGILNG